MNSFIDYLQEVVYSYANGDFHLRVPIVDSDIDMNVIAAAINMLGEELNEKTISKDYFSTILSKLPLPIIVYSTSGKLELTNTFGLKFLECSEDVNIQNTFDYLPKVVLENTLKLVNSKKQKEIVFQLIKKKRNLLDTFYLCKIYKLNNAQRVQYIFIAEDITEIKRNEFLKMNAFLEGEENERKRLAYDLHDSLGQELNIISLFIETLRTMDRNGPEYDSYLEKIKSHSLKSIQTLRDVSYNLMPSYIVNNNLLVVIEQLVNNLNLVHKSSIIYEYHPTELEIGSKDKELMLFRIVQEFLTNSIKHSEAKNISVKVSINKTKKVFTFHLVDTGIGFDENLLFHKNGLNNMIHRLNILHAPYTLISKPSHGTRLNFKYHV
jgi:signal transduction histidine kinase